ncbi:MAG: hypothetical protein PVF74_06330, partial [Anaerolineales bacterium]
MRILNCVSAKGAFQPGENVRVKVRIESQVVQDSVLRVRVFHLNELVLDMEEPATLQIGIQEFELSFQVAMDCPRGYGVTAELVD